MSPCHLSHPCHPHHPDHPVNTVSPQKIVGNMALMVMMLRKIEGLIMMMMVVLVMMMMTRMAMMMMLAWSEREEGWLEGWLSLESASGCQYYCQHCQLNLIMMILMPMIENHRKKQYEHRHNCSIQPSSVHWLSCSIFSCWFVRLSCMDDITFCIPFCLQTNVRKVFIYCSSPWFQEPPPVQRHKKSKLSSWQNITRKNFPDRAYKSFLRQKCAKSETFQTVRKLSRLARKFPHCLETFQII